MRQRREAGGLTDLVGDLAPPLRLPVELHGGDHVLFDALEARHVALLEQLDASLDAGHIPILGCVATRIVRVGGGEGEMVRERERNWGRGGIV